MNKYSLITAVAIAVIVGSIGFGIWGMYSVEQLQFRTEKTPFRYFEFASSEKIRVCNPTPFFVSFSGVSFDIYYLDDLKGTFTINSNILNPNSSEILAADFSSESFSEAQYLFMHMDGEFSGDVPVRLDPNQMKIVINYDTKIIGIIPYQQSETHSAFEFSQMMNKETSCKS